MPFAVVSVCVAGAWRPPRARTSMTVPEECVRSGRRVPRDTGRMRMRLCVRGSPRSARGLYFSCRGGRPRRKGFGLLVRLGCGPRSPCTCRLSTSSSPTALQIGHLISEGASCLDAFSTYPGQTRLPGGAPGGTTGAPEVCPTRSSRTSVGSHQMSRAHNR